MENQFYEGYNENEIVKVTKIIKNHIFYKCVPRTLIYLINLDIALLYCNVDDGYYKLDFNLVDNSIEKKLTIRQFNKAFKILDLKREKGEEFKDIDDMEFIENNNIYCGIYICNRFLKDDIYFENEKEAKLYEYIRKYSIYVREISTFSMSSSSAREYNINIWTDQLSLLNDMIHNFIDINKEIDPYKIIYLIEKNDLIDNFDKYREIVLDNVIRKL